MAATASGWSLFITWPVFSNWIFLDPPLSRLMLHPVPYHQSFFPTMFKTATPLGAKGLPGT